MAKPLTFEIVAQQLAHVLTRFRDCGYFQQAFGYDCVDDDEAYGALGPDPNVYLMQATGRTDLWPFDAEIVHNANTYNEFRELRWTTWNEDEWFDLIEVLHDRVSQPIQGRFHDFAGCGWHFWEFDAEPGQKQFRDEINYVLSLGDPVYELNAGGEVTVKGPEAFQRLMGAAVPDGTDENTITAKVAAATRSFQSRSATKSDRQHAVNDLAAVLELLRDDMKTIMLKDDEGALFNIANNFGIRHNNRKQKLNYDDEVWLRWMFYVYLATVHAVLRVQARQPKDDPDADWVTATPKA